MHAKGIPALEAAILGLSVALVSCSTWQQAHSLSTAFDQTHPFSRLMSAFFCPLLASPLCSRAAFKSATRSEWSGLPSNVTSSISAILLHELLGLLRAHYVRVTAHLISGRESQIDITTDSSGCASRTGMNEAFSSAPCDLQSSSGIFQLQQQFKIALEWYLILWPPCVLHNNNKKRMA